MRNVCEFSDVGGVHRRVTITRQVRSLRFLHSFLLRNAAGCVFVAEMLARALLSEFFEEMLYCEVELYFSGEVLIFASSRITRTLCEIRNRLIAKLTLLVL